MLSMKQEPGRDMVIYGSTSVEKLDTGTPQRVQPHGTAQRCSKVLSDCRDVRLRFYRLYLGIILCFSFIRILFRAATREEEHGC
jgi:hypothetical protein